jgi:3-deoxy-7-phosphoheptulonate synthase
MFTPFELISPLSLQTKIPLEETEKQFLKSSIRTAKQIVSGSCKKLVFIVGPCSIHNMESALIYANRLKKLSDYVKETIFLVMRVYVEKPRTTIGWKGFLYDPYLNGTNDLRKGLILVRTLFKEIASIGLPIATEFVNPLCASYYQDLVTWGFIGARTTSSQVHRELASQLSFPVGFKNTIEGNLSLPINSIISAKTSHTFLGCNENGSLSAISTQGNPFCHLVLRGAEIETNYDKESIFYAKSLQNASGIYHPIMVDCSHGNSSKNPKKQKDTCKKVVEDLLDASTPLLGIMLESFIDEGSQPFEMGSELSPTISITDPCINWSDTEELILSCHEKLLEKNLCIHMKAQST